MIIHARRTGVVRACLNACHWPDMFGPVMRAGGARFRRGVGNRAEMGHA
jgi:hypothetical protein